MPVEIKSGILASEFIFKETFSHQYHASTIIETDEGLLVAWFGGIHESHSDVCIYQSARKDGKWDIPERVADGITNDVTVLENHPMAEFNKICPIGDMYEMNLLVNFLKD